MHFGNIDSFELLVDFGEVYVLRGQMAFHVTCGYRTRQELKKQNIMVSWV
jgi:hypothetical protein